MFMVLWALFFWLAPIFILIAQPYAWLTVPLCVYLGFRHASHRWLGWPVVAFVATIITGWMQFGPVKLAQTHPMGVGWMLYGTFGGFCLLCLPSWLFGRLLSTSGKVRPGGGSAARMLFPVFCGLFLVHFGFSVTYEALSDEPPGTTPELLDANDRLLSRAASNDRFVAWMTALGKGETAGIVVWGLRSRDLHVVLPQPPFGSFGDLRFSSTDPESLLVTAARGDDREMTAVLRCGIRSGDCTQLVAADHHVTSPVETDNGLLFVQRNEAGRPGADFYLSRSDGRVERLTDFGLGSIHRISLLDDALIAAAVVLEWKRHNDADPDTAMPVSSEIFRVAYDPATSRIRAEDRLIRPYVWGGRIATSPSAREGSPWLAFRAAETVHGGYRYDLVVENMETGERRTVTAATPRPSPPMLIEGDRVLSIDYDRDVYSIKDYSIGSAVEREAARLGGPLIRWKLQRSVTTDEPPEAIGTPAALRSPVQP